MPSSSCAVKAVSAALGVALAVIFTGAAGCSSSESPNQTCEACRKAYSTCSFSNLQEALDFTIDSRDETGCAGRIQGAPVRITCTPLELCHKDGSCQPVTYADGALDLGGLDKSF